MIIVGDKSYSAFSDRNVDEFVLRCARFLRQRGYLVDLDSQAACEHVRKRIPQFQQLSLRSEQAITFGIAIELQSNRDLQSDTQLVDGLDRLPAEEPVRIEWLKEYLAQSPEWQV